MQSPDIIKLGKKTRRRLYRSILIGCLAFNGVAYLSAYKLTHFLVPGQFGVGVTKPTSSKTPADIGLIYHTHRIEIDRDRWLETWLIPVASPTISKGTVILFPGSQSSKARQLLAPAQVFHELGYETLLIDFQGVGGSSGDTNTIGMREAEDVALSIDYARKIAAKNPGKSSLKPPIILYGISMGSAAILRAIAQERVHPDAIILEEPFARLVDTVGSRVRNNFIPAFPLAESIVFWGSIQHGFNGFAHNPVDYAAQVQCPSLILQGELDKWTTATEIDRIYRNLRGTKQLSIFPNTGHNLLVTVDRDRWKQNVDRFLRKVKK
jgi:uncharacterized protein